MTNPTVPPAIAEAMRLAECLMAEVAAGTPTSTDAAYDSLKAAITALAPVQPTEAVAFEAWWDSDPERKRFHPMSIARMAWQAASAQAQPTEPDGDMLDLTPVGPGRTVNDWQTDRVQPTEPSAIDLCKELRTAVGLFDGAMPISPKQAWEEALSMVRSLYAHQPVQPTLEAFVAAQKLLPPDVQKVISEKMSSLYDPPVQPTEPSK